MSVAVDQPLEKLLTLLSSSWHGAIAVALYDRPAVPEDILSALRERLRARVIDV